MDWLVDQGNRGDISIRYHECNVFLFVIYPIFLLPLKYKTEKYKFFIYFFVVVGQFLLVFLIYSRTEEWPKKWTMFFCLQREILNRKNTITEFNSWNNCLTKYVHAWNGYLGFARFTIFF